jgi:predicted ArsR family transcriptional regulator
VTEVFAELGFDPEPAADRREVLLRGCPFRAVAREHPRVVCAVHLGLLRGLLERLGGATAGADLQPFVEPEMCVARVGRHPERAA